MNAHALKSRAPVQTIPASLTPLRSGTLQRQCACGGNGPAGECTECRRKRQLGVQPKLRVSQPGDKYEREADRVAEQVIQMSQPHSRRNLDNNREGARNLTKPVGPGRPSVAVRPQPKAPSIVYDVLRSPGRPLDPESRRFMEQRFGHDFSQVRIHTGEKATPSAKALHAHAFTLGQEIVFGANQYRPATCEGRRILAHELAHVVQQSGPTAGRGPGYVSKFTTFPVLQRTTISVEAGCPGTEAVIRAAVTAARAGIGRIANAKARTCLTKELDDAHVLCEDGDVCGSTRYVGSTIRVHQWGGSCPSLPALLVHEAAHKCKIFFTEAFAEACENEAFGGRGATPPEPGEEGGTCEL
jgi:Domain of unknown function (DUF4157)